MCRLICILIVLMSLFCDSGKDTNKKGSDEVIEKEAAASNSTSNVMDSVDGNFEGDEDDSADISIESINKYTEEIDLAPLEKESMTVETFEPESEQKITIYRKSNEIVKINVNESFYPGNRNATFYYNDQLPVLAEVIRYDEYVNCDARAYRIYYNKGVFESVYLKEASGNEVDETLNKLDMEEYDRFAGETLSDLEIKEAKLILSHANNNTIKSQYLNH